MRDDLTLGVMFVIAVLVCAACGYVGYHAGIGQSQKEYNEVTVRTPVLLKTQDDKAIAFIGEDGIVKLLAPVIHNQPVLPSDDFVKRLNEAKKKAAEAPEPTGEKAEVKDSEHGRADRS